MGIHEPNTDDGDLRKADGTTAVSPGFNTWTEADANRPVWLELEVYAETDGTTTAQVDIEVDESGGTTADYGFSAVSPAAVGGSETQFFKVFVPAGATYQINNVADPNLTNAINVSRQVPA